MSYDPTTWQTGDIVTADKLNNIENGILGVETDVGTLKSDITELGVYGYNVTMTTLTADDMEQGAWNATTGKKTSASYRVRTKTPYLLHSGETVSCTIASGYKAVITAFKSEPDGETEVTQEATTGWKTDSASYTASDTVWAIVNIGNSSDTAINASTAAENVTVVIPVHSESHSEIRIDGVDAELNKKATLVITFANMFDKDTMVAGNDKAYDKTGTIEGKTVNLIDLVGYAAIKIPLHGETSVSLKQTTNTGNSMLLWGWYAVDEDMVITSAYGSRISQYIQSGYTLTDIPATAKYLCLSIAYYANAVAEEEYLMVAQGAVAKDYEPYVSPWYEVDNLKADATPSVQEQIDANTAHRQWIGKSWAQYGDSISTYAIMPSNLGLGWAAYVNDYQKFSNTYMRGIGGQAFAFGEHGGSVAFINSDGSLNSINQSYNYDDYTGSVPSGTTKVRGSMCSWLRITSMFPASIKDSIDLVFVMGGTNDNESDTVPTWVSNSDTDPEWAESDYYETYGGDYNITTLQGGVASAIMKLQAWMPDALIVIGTPLNGRTGETGEIKPSTIPTEYEKSNQIIAAARMFAAPVIDVFGTCGINVCNSASYISDGVHPNTAGRVLLGKCIAGALNSILPKS